jgi:prepilin-type N-terminal cleavage/methylation domain-containing protein
MTRNGKRSARQRGFTLIELLMALALGAALLALAAQVFATALNGRGRLRERNASRSSIRLAYETISRDMHSALVPPDDSGLQFGLSTTGSSVGQDVLQLASVVGEPLLAGRAANETVLVQYAIAPDPETNRPTFWRYETPYPIPEGGSVESDPDTRAVPLLVGVADATYTFYSAAQATWIASWEGETGLPTAIRMDLVFEQEDVPGREPGAQQRESWVFNLPAAGYANDAAAAAAAEADAGSTDTGTTTPGGAGGGQ